MLRGIDVSEHQGNIDWNRVKGQVDFVILRAGYGHNNIDKQFENNIKECNRLGIPCGIYWFSYAYSVDMAINEANFAVQAIKNYKIDLPIFFDLEYDTMNYANKCGVNINQRLATDMVKGFCEKVKILGYKTGNYTNQDFILNKFYNNELVQYPLWYAYYNPTKNRDCAIWQYSESGKIDGINTDSVDMNYYYSDEKLDTAPVENLNISPKNELWRQEIHGEEVGALQEQLNEQGFGNIKVDEYFGQDTLECRPILKEGSRGEITRLVQQRLINRGYTSLLNCGGADGKWGAGTTQVIKNLQSNFGLSVDGILGKNTWKALYSLATS